MSGAWGYCSALPARRLSPIVDYSRLEQLESCLYQYYKVQSSLAGKPSSLPWLYLLQVLAGLPTSLAEDEATSLQLQLQGDTGRCNHSHGKYSHSQ